MSLVTTSNGRPPCFVCKAAEGRPCVTKTGKYTNFHVARGPAKAVPGKAAYQPGFRPVPVAAIAKATSTTIFQDAERYVTMAKAFGWADPEINPVELIEQLCADHEIDCDERTEGKDEEIEAKDQEIGELEDKIKKLEKEAIDEDEYKFQCAEARKWHEQYLELLRKTEATQVTE